jgi:N-acetylglucosaminyldiphosphoundecaprenol N-acetyl-beta-D-mannosaminyltransferase
MDLIIAEGQGIPLLAKFFGVHISEHIGLVNLTFKMLELANQNQYKVLLFGATQDINDKASEIIRKKYPDLILCEGINGYFRQEDEDRIINKINHESPDILLIGITYPVKERFSVKYKSNLNTKIIIPCGGAFDVIAGSAKRPRFKFKWIPITWIIRYLQEPKRLFKPILITVLYTVFWVFPNLYIKHLLHIERNPSILKFHKINYIPE